MNGRWQSRGFTLIELLVVLALLGLTAALVGPNLFRVLEIQGAKQWRADLRDYLERLPILAYDNAKPITVNEITLREALPTLPQQLGLNMPAGLSYTQLGVASGGRVELELAGVREVWQVEPVTGVVRQARSER
jgi:prepilin-type N-terminal cleavage/methylation domain-containing protein